MNHKPTTNTSKNDESTVPGSPLTTPAQKTGRTAGKLRTAADLFGMVLPHARYNGDVKPPETCEQTNDE